MSEKDEKYKAALEKKYRDAVKTFDRFPKNIRTMLARDIETAFINRVTALARILKIE